jgi:hypothetical protein
MSDPKQPPDSTEWDVIKRRRRHFFGTEDMADWGLALSGGGIRSATFCLGVLQALARAGYASGDAAPSHPATPLLARFDYLSTVSGGGYIGAFLSALFRPRPLADPPTKASAQAAAGAAFATLRCDPPGRLGTAAPDAVDLPTRWLRENGRYLAPTGPGDLVYDIAIALRNLLAVHFVAGITLLALLLTAFTFRYVTLVHAPGAAAWIELLVQPEQPWVHGAIWGSPWFLMALAGWACIAAPLGIAYWLRLENSSYPHLPCAILGLITTGVFAISIYALPPDNGVAWRFGLGAQTALRGFGALLLLSCVAYVLASLARDGNTTRVLRARLTRWLTVTLQVLLGMLLFSVVETCGQTLYLWLQTGESTTVTVTSLFAFLSLAVAAIRQLAPALAQPKEAGLLTRLPLDLILAVVGAVLLLVLLTAWHALATYLFLGKLAFPGEKALPLILLAGKNVVADPLALLEGSGLLWLLCAVLTCACGYFLGFINLSSLQTMYSARLARAYLGASNRKRFANGPANVLPVTEADPGDDFRRDDYYDGVNLGPAHLINVTINATTGADDQLTLRDRQGMPMSIGPRGIMANGKWWTPGVDYDEGGLENLKIGQWIGISGAAFSTGVGRDTSLGKAMVLALANVRLGWWWNSGKKRSMPRLLGRGPAPAARESVLKTPFWRNQTYLMREFRASFMGQDGLHWYLSDGGHFENTAVFELLRRHVAFAVCCDCGADPDYQFKDLANLMRLARIDFGATFTPIKPYEARVFGRHARALRDHVADSTGELSRTCAGGDNKCALLYRVTYEGSPDQTILLVIKPRLIADAPLDLHEYRGANPDFPQQTTMDQFFDDAQWESYRKLGVLIGQRLFPAS